MRIFSPTPPPEYRLTPSPHGGFYLERWNPEVSTYLVEKAVGSKEEAEKVIEHLSQKPIYYFEKVQQK